MKTELMKGTKVVIEKNPEPSSPYQNVAREKERKEKKRNREERKKKEKKKVIVLVVVVERGLVSSKAGWSWFCERTYIDCQTRLTKKTPIAIHTQTHIRDERSTS